MKTKFLSIIIVLTFALPLKAINRNEHYIVGKFNILNPAITIDSETVSFEKNSEITTEILLKNNSKNVKDTEVSIKISPLGNGIPFTKGLLPDNFSIYDNRNLSSKNFAIVQFNEINCSEEILSKADLFFLKKEDLSFLRNSFYAAHGYIFKNKKLMEEFTRRYEYQGFSYPFNSNFSETDLNEIEKTNINLIKEMENMKESIVLSDLQ